MKYNKFYQILRHTSAIDSGTPSPRTSLMNECLVIAPFTGDSLLNASLSLLSSESLTEISIQAQIIIT